MHSQSVLRKLVLAGGGGCLALCIAGLAWSQRDAPPAEAQEMVGISIRTPLSKARTIPVHLAVGDRLRITLPSNQTTGFSWRLVDAPGNQVVRLTGSEYRAPSDGRLGQEGREVWSFEAVRKGKATLTLEYARPWEKDVPAEKQQTFEVAVE